MKILRFNNIYNWLKGQINTTLINLQSQELIPTNFDIDYSLEIQDYLTAIKVKENGEDNYVSHILISNSNTTIIESKRINAYEQGVSIKFQSRSENRNAIKLLLETFATDINTQTYVFNEDDYSYNGYINIRTMPDFTPDYKAHGILEFDGLLNLLITFQQSFEISDDTQLVINGIAVPYETLTISKEVTTTPRLKKNPYTKSIANINTIVLSFSGGALSDNMALQVLKSDIQSPESLNTLYTVQLMKGNTEINKYSMIISEGTINYEFSKYITYSVAMTLTDTGVL